MSRSPYISLVLFYMVDMRCVSEGRTRSPNYGMIDETGLAFSSNIAKRDTPTFDPFSVIWAFASIEGGYPRTLAGPMRVGTPTIKQMII